jgi:hypothetical protein
LAHEYALTRVNFRDPENSRLVVRMGVDRHNCFGGSCAAASAKMLAAIISWRDAVAPMIHKVPRGVEPSTTITEQQVLEWISLVSSGLNTLAPELHPSNSNQIFVFASPDQN